MTTSEPLDGADTPTRVALLHNGHQHHLKVVQLVNHFAGETIDVKLDHSRNSTAGLLQQLAGCDLILFEAFGQISQEQNAALNWIRMTSFAPLVMLISGAHVDRTIDAILAGADAVMPLNTANDVFVAHCRALVRRWRTRRGAAH